MTVHQRTRRQLHEKLEEVLGVAEAEALMDYLPPVGWADVATSRDLQAVEQRIDALSARVDERFAQLDGRFSQQTAEITAAFRGEIITALTLQTRQTVFAIIGVLLATAGLFAAVLGLG